MDVKNLKDLSKIIDLCHKKRVKTIKIHGIELELREDVPVSSYLQKKSSPVQTSGDHPIVTDRGSALTEEDILFWSSAGFPIETPERSN
jgi:hypothetical protein